MKKASSAKKQPSSYQSAKKLVSNVSSMLLGMKVLANDKYKDLSKEVQVLSKEMSKKGMWDAEHGKKLLSDLQGETMKFIDRTSEDLRTQMGAISDKFMLTKNEIVKTFATKKDLKDLEQRIMRQFKK